jgi:hypothetical protein
MLDSLEKIDWHNYSHHFGTAEDLPELLKKLLTAPSEPIPLYPEAENSFLQSQKETPIAILYLKLFHQDAVYNAVIPTIPFLLELLTYDVVQNKADILRFLYEGARSWTSVRAKAVKDKELWDFLAVEREAYALISQGKELYLKLKNNNDPDVRLLASRMLTLLKRVSVDY